MLAVSVSSLLLSFGGLVLLAVAGEHLYGVWVRRKERQMKVRKGRTCHLCGTTYEEHSEVRLSACPHCGGLNSQGGHRRLV